VGDAAGRPEQKLPTKRRKDHSSADRLMALNVEIPFFTPEQHFLSHKDSEWVKPEFNPKDVDFGGPIADKKVTSDTCEVVIMVGFPGSGKSHFAKQYLEKAGYKLINRDTVRERLSEKNSEFKYVLFLQLGSWQKCVSVLEKTLSDTKQKCVIDNTNPDAESRKRFIDVAKKFKVPFRCFVMNVPYKQCRHNNAFRELIDPEHAQINEMVFNMYKSKYQEPVMAEGFQDIVKVNFVPCFQKAEHEKLYKLYLLEK
jgi:bifunctional polynucleotide phosphatase/kinase